MTGLIGWPILLHQITQRMQQMTPSQLARVRRTVEAAAKVGPIAPDTQAQIDAARELNAGRRAERAIQAAKKSAYITFPEVDRRRPQVENLLRLSDVKAQWRRFDDCRPVNSMLGGL